MKQWKQLVGAGALVAAAVVTPSAVADAGEVQQGTVVVEVRFVGSEADNIDSYRPELWEDEVGGIDLFAAPICSDAPLSFDEDLFAGRLYECQVPAYGDFALGFPAVPAPYEVDASCEPGGIEQAERFDTPETLFTVDDTEPDWSCEIIVSTSMVFVDKYVETPQNDEIEVAGAATSDFTMELWQNGTEVASSAGDAPEYCDSYGDVAAGNCLLFEVAPGDYVLGEADEYGYEVGYVSCLDVGSPLESEGNERRAVEGFDRAWSEQFDTSDFPRAAFTLSADLPGSSVSCEVANIYAEGEITITNTVVNDHGGTAGPEAWTMELFDNTSALVDSGTCNAAGECLTGSYPVGPYTVGQTGPDGYTATFTIDITVGELDVPTEAFPSADATFDLTANDVAVIEVTNDDVAVATTTTAAATTTAVPTTSAAPTTTSIDAGVVTLPPTGSSEQTGTIALLALAFLLLGGTGIAVARRRT